MQRLTSTFLAIAAIALLIPSASADTITQTFSVVVSPAASITGYFAGTAVQQFNPNLGNLNDVKATLSGPATWTYSDAGATFDAYILEQATGDGFLPDQVISPGAVNIDLSGGSSYAGDLGAVTGVGTTTFGLHLFGCNNCGTFGTSPTGLSGTVTYDYTPAPVPEPGTLWLMSAGLVGLLGVSKRRRQQKNNV